MKLGAIVVVVAAAVAGCSSGSPSSHAAPPTTAAPTVPTGPAPVPTSLMITGVGPGVLETPFYSGTTVTSVKCGTSPHGPFVELTIPPGGAPTPSNSALAEPTMVVVIPGKGVVKDHTGKVLYEQDLPGITTGAAGGMVLSMTNVTYITGDDRSVVVGAVNVSGNWVCPSTASPYPGA